MELSRRTFLQTAPGVIASVYGGPAGSALTLSGEVLRKDNTAIESVLVRAYRGAVKIGEDTTKHGGKYSISFDADSPIDTVRYEQTSYVSGVVDDLCGARDHRISKTLYLRKTKLELFEALDTLSALEKIFYIDTENNVSLTTLKDNYVPVLVELKEAVPKQPTSLSERLLAVMKLYRML